MLLLFLVFALILGPQVVLFVDGSSNFKFSFSEVQQCKPLSLIFKGDLEPGDPVPVTLTVLPFNGTAVSIPIPSSAINSTGLNVTFLPFAEDTNFIASLDDASGDNAARVSDIFRVTASGDTSCALQSQQKFVPSFSILDPISQCESFRVRYSNEQAPTIRLFFPLIGSSPLNLVSDDPQTKTATYILAAPRQSQVVLMFNDTVVAETSTLLPVTGDTSSSNSCFPKMMNMTPNNSQPSQASKSGVSKSVAIGLGVGFGILLMLAIPMVWYVIRERRRNRRVMRDSQRSYVEKGSFDDNEKKGDWSYGTYQTHDLPTLPAQPATRPPAPPPFFSYNQTFEKRHQQAYSWEDEYVRDPAYVTNSSPSVSDFASTTISWEMVTDANHTDDRRESLNSKRSQRNTNPLLPSSRDLENMLAEGSAVSTNPSQISHASEKKSNSRSRDLTSATIQKPPAIQTKMRSRTGSGNMTFSASALTAPAPAQGIPEDVSTFLADTTMDDHGNPVFFESPMSMDSHLGNGPRGSAILENPDRVGSRFSAITTASDDSVGQILRVHLQRPEPSVSNRSSRSRDAEDGRGLGFDGSFQFPPTHYSPSPLAKASRQSTASMESWGNRPL
ncbi:hypothetical protein D9758_002596 [Tetrapyrgos nigripes]|uniref:Uncharacterized protein n=1 Tax=Tetrapyrgos nigripes TaxID=182062 RepID=A0A8H5LTI2_9AGAR|nr:hypothetical protein D9758_002596 [Tetrapyrgos nigripes]